jgi:hypothetical protein
MGATMCPFSARAIAFVSSDYYQEFAQMASFCEADLLCHAFAERGYVLEVLKAEDPQVPWTKFAAVLPLGMWGYHQATDAFLRWVAMLEQKDVRLINAPQVLRWNCDKSYLLELRQAGAQVAPLLHFPASSRLDLRKVLADAGWQDYVLKPSVSANAEHTLVGHGPPDAQSCALAEQILRRCGLLIQPLFTAILEEGEWSLIFAEDELVHAVLKRPRRGDFRSQPDHGATVLQKTPSPELAAQALATVRLARERLGPLAYARVDGFVADGRLELIELELIEPYLFLKDAAAAAPHRLVDAVLRQLG